MVPFCLSKAAANTMDSSETFEVADGDFFWRDAHDTTVLLMQGVHVEGTAARHDGQLERESGEAGVPWSWYGAKWVCECSVEDLWMFNVMFDRRGGRQHTVSRTVVKQAIAIDRGSWMEKAIMVD